MGGGEGALEHPPPIGSGTGCDTEKHFWDTLPPPEVAPEVTPETNKCWDPPTEVAPEVALEVTLGKKLGPELQVTPPPLLTDKLKT